ncbi:MAG TPA: hypothetical protein VFO65_11630, partial [Acidimicrobiales bacterium]|nr:hypothetical protein [Acidimicrobiales bacterium]
GRNNRLLRELARIGRAPGRHLHPTRLRDLESAQAFFVHGPQALRRLAGAHAQPPGPVPREVFEILMAAEVRALVGDFHVPADPAAPSRAS